MKKYIFNLFLIIGLCFNICSCSKDNDIALPSLETTTTTNNTVISEKEFLVGTENSDISIKVNPNVNYSVKVPNVSWITENKTSDINEYSFTIHENTEYEDRSANIIFTNKSSNVNDTIKIYQVQKDAIIIAKSEYELNSDSQTLNFNINSNVDFYVSCSENWINEYKTRALAEYPLSFSVNENETGLARNCIITIASKDNTIKQQVKVIQNANNNNESVTNSDLFFSEAVELTCYVFRLADAPEYNQCKVPSVYGPADRYFSSMVNHKAVNTARYLHNHAGISYDAVTAFGTHLVINNGEISFNKSYDESSDQSFNRWTESYRNNFLADLNSFYKESNFHEWYLTTKTLRNEAIASFKNMCNIDYDWYNTFFNTTENVKRQTILSFFIGPNNNGNSVNLTDGTKLLTPVIGCILENNGHPYYTDITDILIHEYCHPYCNPLIDKYWHNINAAANIIFDEANKNDKLSNQAYGTAKTMMYESLVRACTINYLSNHGKSANINSLIKNEEYSGFILMNELVNSLSTYTSSNKYSSLDEYMSEIVNIVNKHNPVEEPTNETPIYTYDGGTLLPGVFNVGNGKTIRFTRGSLYWNGSEYKLENNQLDYLTEPKDDHICYFHWISTKEIEYTKPYEFIFNYFTPGSVDDEFWCGYNNKLTVENTDGLFVLTQREWTYLFKNQNYLCNVTIDGKKHNAILAPNSYKSALKNNYTKEEWVLTEKEGVVCFPPVGCQTNDGKLTNTGESSWWSTSSVESEQWVYAVNFLDSGFYNACMHNRVNRNPIRLVKEN